MLARRFVRLDDIAVHGGDLFHFGDDLALFRVDADGACDQAAARWFEPRQQFRQPVARLPVRYLARHAHEIHRRQIHHVPAGQRQVHRQTRALFRRLLLGDLHHHVVARLHVQNARHDAGGREHRTVVERLAHVQKGVALQTDVDERGLQPLQHVLHPSFVNIAGTAVGIVVLDVIFVDPSVLDERNARHIRFDVYENLTLHFIAVPPK